MAIDFGETFLRW